MAIGEVFDKKYKNSNMKDFTRFTIVVLLLISNISLLAQNTLEIAPAIDQVVVKQLKALLKNKEISSVSFGLYQNGATKTYHYGVLEKGKQDTAPNDSSLYEIASVTKTMTGYLLALAAQEEKISLDDDIRKYLDEKYPNLEFDGKPITIKHLLTHTSGLGHFMSNDMTNAFKTLQADVPDTFYKAQTNYDKKHFFKDLRKVTLTESPGNSYHYSNAGAELIGYILEKIYAKPIDQLFKEKLFDKASMHYSIYGQGDQSQEQPIKGYWMNNSVQSPSFINPLWGTGTAIKSTVVDMLNYIQFQLDSNNSIATASREILYKDRKTLKIGYFWRIWEDKYGRSYHHHGGTSGVQNWLYIYPKYNSGLFIITNQSGNTTPGKLNKVVKKVIQEISKQKL